MNKEEIVMTEVEIKHHHDHPERGRIFDWQTIPVKEALKLAEPYIRCPECHGAVRLHRASEDGSTPPRAEHRKRNTGCSLGDRYDGTPKMAIKQVG